MSTSATAYVQLPGGWFQNNAGWITGDDRTLLVDTCATEQRSRELITAARASARTDTAPSVVLTHAHGDHVNGARLVAEAGGSVLSSDAAAHEIAAGPHTFPDLFRCSTWGDITPPAETEVVAERTIMDLGGRWAEILPVPGQAHTTGDLVVRLPDEGVLFTGDLLFSGVTPLAAQGSVTGWLDALSWLRGFGASHLVPGHGPVAHGDEPIDALVDYFRWVLDAVADERCDFDALEQRARHRWPDWLDAERHQVNLRVAHSEVHGTTAAQADLFEAMHRSAGGPITLDL